MRANSRMRLRLSRIILIGMTGLAATASAGVEISGTRQAALLNLLKQDCGSCHGLTMKGGLGPALTPEALRGKPASMLREVVLRGRPGTPMPPWAPFLSETEADWLIEVLLKGETNARR